MYMSMAKTSYGGCDNLASSTVSFKKSSDWLSYTLTASRPRCLCHLIHSIRELAWFGDKCRWSMSTAMAMARQAEV